MNSKAFVPLLVLAAAFATARVANDAAAPTELLLEGREVFRHDTFGDESFWGGTLGLHNAIQGAAFGGVGPGLSPLAALGAGLRVDVESLDKQTIEGLIQGTINLSDPAVTLALLDQDAVVGVKGFAAADGSLESLGITCALCHSTVDDSFAPGIGRRRDGWANRDLNVGAIISLAPDLSFFANLLGVTEDDVRAVLATWGPGRFDAHLILDGQAFRPDGDSASVLIPAAYGLAGVDRATYNGWGSVTHWNALVANLEMGGSGTFVDPRLNNATRFPVAAANGFANVANSPDLVTSKLAALHAYQLALEPPPAPKDGYAPAAAARGKTLFEGVADCARCHVPPLYTEPGHNLHDPSEIGIDSFQADRGPEGKYRTTPLRGLHAHLKGGLYHDGRFVTPAELIDHYDTTFALGLTPGNKLDLEQYLRSL
jgi:cytochrome c5